MNWISSPERAWRFHLVRLVNWLSRQRLTSNVVDIRRAATAEPSLAVTWPRHGELFPTTTMLLMHSSTWSLSSSRSGSIRCCCCTASRDHRHAAVAATATAAGPFSSRWRCLTSRQLHWRRSLKALATDAFRLNGRLQSAFSPPAAAERCHQMILRCRCYHEDLSKRIMTANLTMQRGEPSAWRIKSMSGTQLAFAVDPLCLQLSGSPVQTMTVI